MCWNMPTSNWSCARTRAGRQGAAGGRPPGLRRIVVIETKGLRSYAVAERARIVTFAQVEEDGQRREDLEQGALDAALDGQRLADIGLMIYTSGSTGKPKGAMLSYRNMRGVAWGIAERLEMDARSVHLSHLPLCHVAEQMLSTFVPIYVGSQVNFGESIRTVQEDLREVAPSIFLGVPRIWEKLHAAISIKMQEAGRLQQWLYRRALAACARSVARAIRLARTLDPCAMVLAGAARLAELHHCGACGWR